MKGFKKKIILVPDKITNAKRKHKNKKEWITIYYYLDKKRCKAIIDENVCSSKVELRRNCMYKISNLSKNDNLYDYYKILKPHIAENLRLKEVGRLNTLKSRTNKREELYNYKRKNYPKNDNSWKGKKIDGLTFQKGPIILHF
tara:strand:+ start:446 stop:874 length:429 start_codon:yes stop_codon:yes gene_type:complete